MSFLCLQIPQKTTKLYLKISAYLASKKRSNKKKRALYTTAWRIYFDYLTILIWIDLFLGARAEIILLVFWEIWRHPKEHFEIKWPLVSSKETTAFLKIHFSAFRAVFVLNFCKCSRIWKKSEKLPKKNATFCH